MKLYLVNESFIFKNIFVENCLILMILLKWSIFTNYFWWNYNGLGEEDGILFRYRRNNAMIIIRNNGDLLFLKEL